MSFFNLSADASTFDIKLEDFFLGMLHLLEINNHA